MNSDEHDPKGKQITCSAACASANDPTPLLSKEGVAEVSKPAAPDRIHAGRATGPHTERGKQKSRSNAVKHGIFSVVVLPRSELGFKYRALAKYLIQAIQPVGRLEEMLVEKLAMLFWRYRRVLQTEGTEIEKAIDAAYFMTEEEKILRASIESRKQGLILASVPNHSKEMLLTAIAKLKDMRQKIENEGPKWERDRETLKLLYGTMPEFEVTLRSYGGRQELVRVDPEPRGPLAKTYRELTLPRKTNSDAGASVSVPPDALRSILEMLTEEIDTYTLIAKSWYGREAYAEHLPLPISMIPPPEVAERLQRYEIMLERSIDRTLGQLDRLQRMRRGQPVSPTVKVELAQ